MDKKTIIKKNQKHPKDTGSSKVQIALLKERVKKLSAHLKIHPKDNHSRRGLMGMLNKRKKLEKYLGAHKY